MLTKQQEKVADNANESPMAKKLWRGLPFLQLQRATRRISFSFPVT